MNHFYQTIRIVLLLVLIFVAGVWTGRFTAPRRQFVVVGAQGGVQLVETALARMKVNVRLTPEEEEKVRKLLEEMEVKVSPYPPLADERIEIFRSYVPRMKEVLPPDQHEAFEKHIRAMERRFEANQRRRGLK